jgi:sugar lactone lactonase YvrE
MVKPASTTLTTVLLFASIFLLLLSCGDRERVNPLDPLNPSTGGAPPGFSTVALDSRVELRWSPLALTGLRGFNIYRAERTERRGGVFELVHGSPFPPGIGQAVDSSVVNRTTYDYKLLPLIEDYGEGTPSSLLPATPGPYFAVATDGWGGSVRKFSADMGASVWTVGGLYYPFSVSSDGQDLWVTDLFGGLFRLAGDGTLLWRTTGFLLPLWVSVRANGTSAVADPILGVVTKLSSEGQVELTISEGLEGPSCVAFGPQGEIWVADPVAGRVNKYSSSGSLLRSFTGCAEPRFVDVEATGGACWVGDPATAELIRLSADAAELTRVGFSSVNAVEVDEYAGDCWVADVTSEEIARVSGEGEIVFRIGRVGRVAHIYVTHDEGSVWVADEEGGRLLAFTRGGKLLSSTASPTEPTSLTVLRPNE